VLIALKSPEPRGAGRIRRAILVKTLAETTENSENWRVNWRVPEFATFFQLPE
jgi:hypothetical protein